MFLIRKRGIAVPESGNLLSHADHNYKQAVQLLRCANARLTNVLSQYASRFISLQIRSYISRWNKPLSNTDMLYECVLKLFVHLA